MTEKNQVDGSQNTRQLSDGNAEDLFEQFRKRNRLSSVSQQIESEQEEKIEYIKKEVSKNHQEDTEDTIEELDVNVQEVSEKVSKTIRVPISQLSILKSIPIFCLIFIGVSLSLYFIGPWSKKKEIVIAGNVNLSTDDILQYSLISEKDYVFTTFFHREEIEENIKNGSDWIESDSIQYEFPNRFNIVVKEYSEMGYIKENNAYQAVLSNGDIVKMLSDDLPESATLINLQDKELIKKLAIQLGKIDKDILLMIQTIDLTPSKATSDLLTLKMEDDNKILVPLSDISEKLPYYKKIARQLLVPSTVDMEVGIFSYAN